MALEKEIKFALVGFSEVRTRLGSLGASFLHRQLESNEIWDLPDLQLKQSHCLLRLRTEEFANGETRSILTFKSKALPCSSGSPDNSAPRDNSGIKDHPDENDTAACKIRNEDETIVQSPEAMRCILRGLGYRPVALYQKLREEWSLTVVNSGMNKDMNSNGEVADAIFCLDYLPFGHFLEIEAHDPVKVAKLLQLNPSESLVDSYHKINQDRKALAGEKASPDFVFDETAWRRMRQTLAVPLP